MNNSAPAPLLSRGLVLEGTANEVAARYSGTVVLAPCSFTDDDELADAFASMDDDIEPGHTRLKLFVEAGTQATPAGEAEFIVAGIFTTVGVAFGGNVVSVTLRQVA